MGLVCNFAAAIITRNMALLLVVICHTHQLQRSRHVIYKIS
nr:MAG TPA: hypothetical protein [Caudoviricetes sp.]